MFKSESKTIGVAFFKSINNPLEKKPDGYMEKMNFLSDWWHGTSEPSYLHCCIILNSNGKDFVYHLDFGGPRIDGLGDEKEKKFEAWGWQLFKAIKVSKENWRRCKDYLDDFYDKYAGSDHFHYDKWYTYLTRLMLYYHVGQDCVPWKEETWNCAEFVCEALQCANITELKGKDAKYMTTHMISELLKKYPNAGPNDFNALKLDK